MTDSHAKIDLLLVEYMQRVDSGQSIDREEFLQQHAEYAEELRELLEAGDEIERLASPAAVATPSPEGVPTGKLATDTADSAADIYQEETWNPTASDTASNSLPPADSSTAEPKLFGDYELLGEIARGGMGVVFQARQVKLNRVVALKMILAGQLASQDEVARFYVEAQAAAALRHPNIVPVHDVGEHEGQHYLSMGYVDGQSLADRLAQGPMPPREAANLVRKLATAMSVAHNKGVIHRDLKPANVLLEKNGNPCITDFGLAKQTNSDNNLTASGLVFGTPSYMAPEQAAGETAEIGPLADVYSLGAILHCCLTGKPPFEAANVVKTIQQVIHDEPEAIRTLNPKVPQELDAICLKCLQKSPEKRYASADELAAALKQFLLKSKQQTTQKIDTAATPASRSRKGRTIGIAAAAAVLLPLIVWAVTLFFRVGEVDVKVVIDDPSAKVYVDGEVITITGVGDTIKLKPGPHDLIVKRGDIVVQTDKFEVFKGKNSVLRITVNESVAVAPPGPGSNPPDLPPTFGLNTLTLKGHTGHVYSVDFSPDGKRIVSGCGDKTVKVWDALTGQEIQTLKGHAHSVFSVAISPNGKRFVSGSEDTTIKVWDPENGQEIRTLRGHTGGVRSVAFSPDGKWIVSGGGWSSGAGSEIKLWDAATGANTRTITGLTAAVVSVAFSPDGKRIVSGIIDKTVKLWNPATGECTRTLIGHTRAVTGVAFSPDGRRIVSYGHGKTIKLWDSSSGDELWSRNLSGSGRGISFSPDGKRIVCGHQVGQVKLLDVSTGQETLTLKSHTGTSWSVAFGPEGKRIASAYHDGTIEVWDLTGSPARTAGAPLPAVAPFDPATAKKHQQAWAKYLGVPVEKEVDLGDGVQLKMVLIPPGEFLMGHSEDEMEHLVTKAKSEKTGKDGLAILRTARPRHRVRITGPFWVGIHEVTRGQFREFIEATKYQTDAEKHSEGGLGIVNGAWLRDPKFKWDVDPGYKQTDDHPVVNVTWNDSVAFCKWLSQKESEYSFRLLTEAEWEYVCRAGTTGRWPVPGDAEGELANYAWYDGNGMRGTKPVGTKSPNAFGMFDMLGNVNEFCGDWYSSKYESRGVSVDPKGLSFGVGRILRGGAFHQTSTWVRSAVRSASPPSRPGITIGLRVAQHFDAPIEPAKFDTKRGVQANLDLPVENVTPGDQPISERGPSPPPAIAPFNEQQAKAHQQAWADHLGVPVETTNSIGMKFRVIPPGEFLMGSPKKEIEKLVADEKDERYVGLFRSESPQHTVTITNPFLLGIHQVTRGQFRKFIDDTGHKTRAEIVRKGMGWIDQTIVHDERFIWRNDPGFPQTDQHPVVNVTWDDAAAFCRWLSAKEGKSYRLATEAEWEYACRSGTTSRYSFDENILALDRYIWFNQRDVGTVPVGQKRANGFGLFDMHGNVYDWCQDWYDADYYSHSPTVNPSGPLTPTILGERVIRGGSFILDQRLVRSAFRFKVQHYGSCFYLGFRVVRSDLNPETNASHGSPVKAPVPISD